MENRPTFLSVSRLDTLLLHLGLHCQKEMEIRQIPQPGMAAIGAFCNGDDAGLYGNRFCECLPAAVVWAVGKGFAFPPGQQHLLPESFGIHIASRLGEPLGSALFRTKEKIVQRKHRTVKLLLQFGSQGGFSGGASPVNGHHQRIVLGKAADLFQNLLDHG